MRVLRLFRLLAVAAPLENLEKIRLIKTDSDLYKLVHNNYVVLFCAFMYITFKSATTYRPSLLDNFRQVLFVNLQPAWSLLYSII